MQTYFPVNIFSVGIKSKGNASHGIFGIIIFPFGMVFHKEIDFDLINQK